MKITKLIKPVIKERGVFSWNENGSFICDDGIIFGSKIHLIIFDDIEFSTPPPKLPLKYRLKNIFDRKEG